MAQLFHFRTTESYQYAHSQPERLLQWKRNEEQIPRACSEFLWSFTIRLHSVKMQSQNCQEKGGLCNFTNLKADLITALDSAGTGCEQHGISDTYRSVFEMRYKAFEMRQGKTFTTNGNRYSHLHLWIDKDVKYRTLIHLFLKHMNLCKVCPKDIKTDKQILEYNLGKLRSVLKWKCTAFEECGNIIKTEVCMLSKGKK